MALTEFTMKLIILFLPGIISTVIISSLISRSRLSNRDYLVSTILFGFISYLLFNIFLNLIEILKKGFDDYKYIEPNFINALTSSKITFDYSELIGACFISIIIGFILAKIINFGIIYSFARKFNISNRTAEEDTWGSLFYNCNKGISRYVYVIEKDLDIVYGGWVSEHSRNHINNELLLKDVVCYKNSNREEKLRHFDYLYIAMDKEDLIIEMKEECESNERKVN